MMFKRVFESGSRSQIARATAPFASHKCPLPDNLAQFPVSHIGTLLQHVLCPEDHILLAA